VKAREARQHLKALERRRDHLGQRIADRDRTRRYPAWDAGEVAALNWAIALMRREIDDRREELDLEQMPR
jgi:hypothetical protein